MKEISNSIKKENKKETTPVEVKENKPELGDINIQIHEMGIQIDDLKLAIASLTKGLKGVYEELDTHANKLGKVADRLGL